MLFEPDNDFGNIFSKLIFIFIYSSSLPRPGWLTVQLSLVLLFSHTNPQHNIQQSNDNWMKFEYNIFSLLPGEKKNNIIFFLNENDGAWWSSPSSGIELNLIFSQNNVTTACFDSLWSECDLSISHIIANRNGIQLIMNDISERWVLVMMRIILICCGGDLL